MHQDKNGTLYRVREKELATKQTDNSPRIIQLRREFAEHPSRGLNPATLAAILTDAEQGNQDGDPEGFHGRHFVRTRRRFPRRRIMRPG